MMLVAENDLEPLVLADGTRIDPVLGKPIKSEKRKYVEVPSRSEAQELVVKSRKTVAELPLPPENMHGVALVAFYTLFGLPSKEVALAVGSRLTVPQIDNIKQSDAYKQFMANARENIIETSAEQVRDLFQKNAINAANKVLELADSENDVLAFKASQDVLDRAGHRPADIVEHKHQMSGGLEIVITRKGGEVLGPIIDMPEDISYADSNG